MHINLIFVSPLRPLVPQHGRKTEQCGNNGESDCNSRAQDVRWGRQRGEGGTCGDANHVVREKADGASCEKREGGDVDDGGEDVEEPIGGKWEDPHGQQERHFGPVRPNLRRKHTPPPAPNFCPQRRELVRPHGVDEVPKERAGEGVATSRARAGQLGGEGGWAGRTMETMASPLEIPKSAPARMFISADPGMAKDCLLRGERGAGGGYNM